MSARPSTAPRVNPDGSITATVKRACNGCGRVLGDATNAEMDCAVNGQPLIDVSAECGCRAVDRTDAIVECGEIGNTPIAFDFPQPDGYRGSGEPVWHANAASVSLTEPYNRADSGIPTVTIAGTVNGEWTLPAARQLALAILASIDWTSDTDDPPSPENR